MCGRFALTATTKDVEKLLPGFRADNPFKSRYNIAPTQDIIVALSSEPEQLCEVRWGLIPRWASDISIGNKMFNARAETLTEKPSFRHLVNRKRCLIFADGFYEWQTIPNSKKKLPYLIYFDDGLPFTFGGLWEQWKNPNDGTILTTTTIITTQANEFMSSIHNRMPVIIDEKFRKDWLSIDVKFDDLAELTIPRDFNNLTMEVYEKGFKNENALLD